ncbi:MAG: 2Fe-2S ferredoxin [Phycisphaeraceae bacterium]|nr:2Fe-2S ferredoxin [Phycisphaeraceae bacterium]
MNKTRVIALDELADGAMKTVRAAGRDLLLVRRGDKVYAIRDICIHQGARLSDGVLTCTRRGGRVGEYVAEKVGRIVRCPWHNWEYDVESGACLHDPEKARVASYDTYIEDGAVWVMT